MIVITLLLLEALINDRSTSIPWTVEGPSCRAVGILEAIVGAILSAEEIDAPPIVRRDDGSWLDDDRDYHTVGGLAMIRLGRVPVPSDTFDIDGLRFEVLDMDGKRVDKVLVTRHPKAADHAAE